MPMKFRENTKVTYRWWWWCL